MDVYQSAPPDILDLDTEYTAVDIFVWTLIYILGFNAIIAFAILMLVSITFL